MASTVISSITAKDISSVPSGTITSQNVQGAINELEGNKATKTSVSNVLTILNRIQNEITDIYSTKANSSSGGVPVGVIAMWSGNAATIPANGVLCNGLNNTPNLMDRFVVGAGSTYGVGATSGEATYVLTIAEMPSHNHGTSPAGGPDYLEGRGGAYPGGDYRGLPWATGNAGSGAARNNLPPYYALCYIMRIA